MDTLVTTASSCSSEQTGIESENGIIIGPIPLLLYEELSRTCCRGDELSGGGYGNGFWKRRALNAEDERIGFAGTIGVRKQFEDFYFTLWYRTFESITDPEELDYLKRKSEVLVLSSGVRRAGLWTYARGNLMTESNTFSFRLSDTNLSDLSIARAVQFAATSIAWASEMAHNTKSYSESFWEADRNPEGDYTEPDD